MKPWTWSRLLLNVALALPFWAVIAGGCLLVGSSGHLAWPSDRFVQVFRLRVVGVASIVGAALAASGVVYQAILRNPLADPYLLGVSSGATLTSFLWRLPAVAGISSGISIAISQQACAFTGAVVSVALVFALAGRRGRLEPVTLLLVGVIVNAVNGALFLFVNALRPELTAATGGMLSFLVGGIQTNLSSSQIVIAAACSALGWLILVMLAPDLNVALLGEAEAQGLGVRIHRLRWVALVVASIVTAAAVAISGPIGFVGLICPHLGRLLVGHDHRRLLPIATAMGAALLTLADAATRLLASRQFDQTLLPVGVLTALLGGPFFLFLLLQERRRVAVE